MGRNIDIGGYFEKLTRRGRGGRRRDAADGQGDGTPDITPDVEAPAGSSSPESPDVRRGRLDDLLGRGRGAARRAAQTARSTASRLPLGRSRRGGGPPAGSVVTVEYSPQLDGDPDPGEVVWTWVPFEDDPSQGKDRPVVIVGRRGSKLVGIPLTTKPNDHEAQLKIGTGGWDPRRRTSYARLWRLVDVEPERMRREGAVLEVSRFEQLVEMLDRYYDVR